MQTSPIDKFYEENQELLRFLEKADDLSLINEVENSFKKNLILSCASFFEKQVTDILQEFTAKASNQNNVLLNFVMNKAIKRQYHTLFNWTSNNANQFFGLFGNDFKKEMENKIKEDSLLEDNIKAFIEIGRERNELVHTNFVEASTNKTIGETYQLYLKAQKFVDFIRKELLQKA